MSATTLAFPTPASLGSLDHYIQAVNRFPLLSAEQEVQLGRRLRDHNDLDAARQLVLSHLRLVVAVSRNYLGYGLPQSDLIQEGNVGLMKAVRRFDPERGVRLVSFALHWIKAEIHEYILRNWRLVKIATTKAQRKLFFNLRSMKPGTAALTRKEASSIARALGVKPEEVIEMETRLSGQDIALEPQRSVAMRVLLVEDEKKVASFIKKGLEEEQYQVNVAHDGEDGLRQALGKLDHRSRNIIEARWLREEDQATLQELADQYGVSAERIRQIESKALKTMRNEMGEL